MSLQRPDRADVLTAKTCSHCGSTFGVLDREFASSQACNEAVAQRPAPVPKLSLREKQIVTLIQQAKSNKEIAYELFLTVGTVKEYIYHIFRKVGVTNRTELALWGRDSQAERALVGPS